MSTIFVPYIRGNSRNHSLSEDSSPLKVIEDFRPWAWTMWTKLSSIKKIGVRVSEMITSQSIKSNPKNTYSKIQQSFRFPGYLDGVESQEGRPIQNDNAIEDLLDLIFIHLSERICLTDNSDIRVNSLPFSYGKNSRKRVRLILRYLKWLSQRTGLIDLRSSGHSAFSHWLEAGYIYLVCDPHPTIDGFIRVVGHDTEEDPRQWINSKEVGLPIRTGLGDSLSEKLQRILGSKNHWAIVAYQTKPPISPNTINLDGQLQQATAKRLSWAALLAFKKERNPEWYELARSTRNTAFIARQATEANDRFFLEKMPDLLSNLRSLDAFLFSAGEKDWAIKKAKDKMRRKCLEVLNGYIPRLLRIGKIADIYLIQILVEIGSLNAEHSLWISEQHWKYYEHEKKWLNTFEQSKYKVILLSGRSIMKDWGPYPKRPTIEISQPL